MKKTVLTPEEKKARKSSYDKQYRERKKGIFARPSSEETLCDHPETSVKKAKASTKKIKEVMEKTFDFPVRLYWNGKMEKEKSSCAKAGTPLSFEEIKRDGEFISYRVRRGKRNFFTTSKEMGLK